MSALIKNWILSIMTVSIICSVVLAVTEKTSASKVIKIICALSLILTVAAPLKNIVSFNRFDFSVAEHINSVEVQSDTTRNLQKEVSEENLSSYLKNYAEANGIWCRVKVSCDIVENEIIPCGVTLFLPRNSDDNKINKLKEKIKSEFNLDSDEISVRFDE